VIRHPIFWLMYFMFVIVGAGGLMVTANLKPIAVDWKVDSVPVTLMAMTMTGGDVRCDHRPRPQRTDPAFLRLDLRHDRPREHDVHRVRHRRRRHLGALCSATIPSLFVILSGLVFFAWG
jgi:OFA family oxalate/formate antiporter-like MFS transporter